MTPEEAVLAILVEEKLIGHLHVGQRVRHIQSKDKGTVLEFMDGVRRFTSSKRIYQFEYRVRWDYPFTGTNEETVTWRGNITPIVD